MGPVKRIVAYLFDPASGVSQSEIKSRIPDAASRRHLSWGFSFDSRAISLGEPVQDHWDADLKEAHLRDKEATVASLISEFGAYRADFKVQNFIDIGPKSMSVLTHHNKFFDQVRKAFVAEQYYPALVGACALGERILNHLVLDLRAAYIRSPEYKLVHNKQSFDNWDVPIDTLEAWEVLLPVAAAEFRALKLIRHRSIHFNVSTYATLREDALAAILHLQKIIDEQFASFALRPWFITGTKGHVFIRKEFESHPFIVTYYLPRCPFVGPMFGMLHKESAWYAIDYANYGSGTLSDEDFARAYNDRDETKVATAVNPELNEFETKSIEPNSD